MPKIHDDKKKNILEGKAPEKAGAKVKAGGPGVGFAKATESLKPKAKPTPQKSAAQQLQVPKLSTFKSCGEPLQAAINGAQAGASGMAQLSRALEALSEQLRATAAETEYMQKGDLHTRLGLSNEQKHELSEKAEADAAELESILDVVSALSEVVSKEPEAATIVDRAAEDLTELLHDTTAMARTFGAEGFILEGQKAAAPAAPPPKVAKKEEPTKKPAAEVKKKPAALPKPAAAAKAPAPKATKVKAKAA